jgi:hypothetical protein
MNGMSEAEARLMLYHRNGEPSDGERLDYWFANQLSAFLSVHRRAGSAPVTAKQLMPGWGWHGKSVASEHQQVVNTARGMRAAFKAMAAAQAKRKETAAANPKPGRVTGPKSARG